MMMRNYCLVLALLVCGSARAASITDPGDPLGPDPTIITEVSFNNLVPAGTTVTGFQLTYANAFSTISGLALLSGPVQTLATNGTNQVTANFTAPLASGDVRYTFNTPSDFPITALDINFVGQSKAITGGTVTVTVEPFPVPEVASVVLLGTGFLGVCLVCYRSRQS